MQIIDLFSGIGGFSLAGRWMGWEIVAFCEIDSFCQKVLKHHWPEVPVFDDVKTLTGERIKNETKYKESEPSILVGGFPCQPFSMAGKRKGTEDDRHLWPEMYRIIREIKPTYIVGENVYGFVNWSGGMVFNQVLSDLESEGYEVQPFIIPAAAVNAPHRRDRVWIVAHAKDLRNRRDTGAMGEKTAEPIGQNDGAKFDCSCQNGPPADRCTGDTRTGYAPSQGECECTIEGRKDTGSGVISGQDICGRVEERGCGESGHIQTAKDGPTPDTENRGCETGAEQRSKTLDNGRLDDNGLGNDGGQIPESTPPDTDSGQRCEGRLHPGGGQTERHAGTFDARYYERPGWHNFPTEPPLRSRDDGFSARLDGITVSKLRNESIKAAGNAIVPQVAYQIFRAIDKITKTQTNVGNS